MHIAVYKATLDNKVTSVMRTVPTVLATVHRGAYKTSSEIRSPLMKTVPTVLATSRCVQNYL